MINENLKHVIDVKMPLTVALMANLLAMIDFSLMVA
jgi:hypothetical protein